MATLELRQVEKTFDDTRVIHGIDLAVADGEFVVFVGPSGCGKSTLLRMICGLEQATRGDILIDGARVNDVSAADRGLAMVFQSYALYPHMTVAENIGFHLKIKKIPKAQRAARVREAARILDLTELLDRKPANLSGGQRQRVAMGRAIIREPQVFLMDEPLSNLDAKLRVQTRTQIAALQRDLGVTTVYVTHDQIEAMTMGDRVAVMHNGVLQQCASPKELFTDPINAFVAGFIGSPSMNLLAADTDGEAASYGSLRVSLTPGQRAELTSRAVTIGVRPNDLDISTEGGLDATVEFVEELGSEAFLYCIADGTGKEVVARTDGLSTLRTGDRVSLVPKPAGVHLFDTSTGARLVA
jgi:multiple sugar transport system ATP-binding protein